MKPSMRSYVRRRMPLLWTLIMPLNQRGVQLDQVKLKQFQLERTEKKRTWRKRAEQHWKELGLGELRKVRVSAGKSFQTRLPIGPTGSFSNKLLRKLLYEEMGFEPYKNPEGIVTADKNALKYFEKKDTTGTLAYLRENSKLEEARTALTVKPDRDGRVRTRFVWGGDEKYDADETGRESPGSGRLASRDPNLQNVPDWTRAIYIARHPTRKLLKADYSQIEMRLIAYLSGDPELAKAIETDAHLYITYVLDRGSDIYGLWKRGYPKLLRQYRANDPEVVFARDQVKHAGSYGWGYRMGAKTLEKARGIPFQNGKKILAELNAKFHHVVEWWAKLEAEVYRTSEGSGYGYLQNEYGRIRNFFLDKNVVPKICNFPPQSLAADILYDAMEELEAHLKDFDSELVLTAHDEVVIDTPDPKALAPYVKEVMERPIPELDGLVIPLDIMVGYNWAKYHKHGVSCKGPCSKHENLNGQKELA